MATEVRTPPAPPPKWRPYFSHTLILAIFVSTFSSASCFATPLPAKTYIVQMDHSAKPEAFLTHDSWYTSMLQSVISTTTTTSTQHDPSNRIIYTYKSAFHGLAAQLTESEAQLLKQQSGVLAIFPETKNELHTTRSPTFLRLEPQNHHTTSVFSQKTADNDVIVAILDTGIWPESQSFNDSGMAPVPSHWKGECEVGRGFSKHNCNNKIIGARIFYKGYEAAAGQMKEDTEYKSPRDQDGHGTHTAATVAGSLVKGANLLGYAYGNARGMAPSARVAVYKVCWLGGCFSSDILSAVDKAVDDGVHVMSISLGGGVSSYVKDSVSIATFGAMEKGVFVSCSAGNGGPNPVSLTNVAPWVTTVGASTMDRDFPAELVIGTGMKASGVSIYRGEMMLSPRSQYPLAYFGGNLSEGLQPSSLCLEGTLDPKKVKGKIVICDRGINPRVQKGQVVKDAGGIGMILVNTEANGEELVADSHLLPAVAIGEKKGKQVKHYAISNRNPTATISFFGTKLGIRPSPVVAAFSSRGPNILSLDILKPDIIAPGVNILAAWTGEMGPSSLPTDRRKVDFNILSGTSMSCPHVSGIAALLKARHPEWSPATIKSALMTTAYVHSSTINPIIDAATGLNSTVYDHGAGHINPVKALDPGLVYDISADDYFEFLCAQRLSPADLKVFSKSKPRSCRHTIVNPGDLNYPALSVVFPQYSNVSALTLRRTVTNVGNPVSSYKVRVTDFRSADVVVKPKVLKFSKKNEKLTYAVTFKKKVRQQGPESGYLAWKDGVHRVRSPIVITWLQSPV